MGDYQWTGELDAWRDDLGSVEATGLLSPLCAKSAPKLTIHTLADYERHLRETGYLQDEERLAERPDLVAVAQAHWHAMGHSGCEFAKLLSTRRVAYGWLSFVLEDRGSSAADAAALDDQLEPHLTDPKVEVVSFILPHATEPSTVAELVIALGARERWRFRLEGTEQDAELGPVVKLGLDVDVGLEHRGEVLGFGPWTPLVSRRGPFFELAVRVKPPARPDEKRRARMSDIDLKIERADYGEMYHTTLKKREVLLGTGYLTPGEPGVTVIVPEADWERASA
jgi:hypothetical protein